MEPLGKKLNSIDGVVKYYAIFMSVLAFAGFPIAVFIPIGHGFNIFDFFLPAFLLASGISAALLIMLRKGSSKLSLIEICCTILFVCLLIATLINSSPGAEFLKYTGLALIPLAFGLSVKAHPDICVKALKYSGALLWILNVIHCYHRLPYISNVGICGNRNWLSALILASAPLAIWVLKGLLAKFIKNEKANFILCCLLVIAVSVPIISSADSRASYVALLALPIYLLFVCSGKKVKIGLGIALVLGAVLVPVLLKDLIERENKRNVRVPMWTSTLHMLADNPLGVGPGNFESKFPSYVTKEQKVMLVSAETTVHPHNELLHVMTLGGVPAGICWIIIVGFALFYRHSNKEDLYFKIPLFILFVQGMMDKPLFQMPTMLLFYLLVALCLGREGLFNLELKKPPREKLGLYKGLAAIIILGFSFFAIMLSASSWFERKAMIAAHAKKNDEALAMYEKSFNYASWRLLPAYKAFIITTKDKPDPVKAIGFYDALESRAPDYRQFNLLKGSFFSQLALQDREQAQVHLEKAWQSYNRACELNITNVLSFVDRMKFASRFLPVDELEKSYESLSDLYRFKARGSVVWFSGSLEDWGAQWRKNSKYSEFLSASSSYMGMMKPTYFHSVHFPQDMQALLPVFGGPLNIGDMVYATDSFSLMESLPKGDLQKQAAFILKEIKLNGSKKFSWPKETLKNKISNRISKLCLLAIVARNHGFDPFIHRSTNTVFLFKSGKYFLIDESGLKFLSTEAALTFSRGKLLEYFDYPQGFFYKNEFLSYILHEAKAAPQYCRNPDYVINNQFKRLSGNAVKFAIVKEPFLDIQQRMQGQRTP